MTTYFLNINTNTLAYIARAGIITGTIGAFLLNY
jgi:hypothetical protein